MSKNCSGKVKEERKNLLKRVEMKKKMLIYETKDKGIKGKQAELLT